MGFNKRIKSRKDVTMNYWRLKSLSLNEGGTLIMRVAGYKEGKSYAAGAEPIDEYECIVNNVSSDIKTRFYDLLEQQFPLFEGAVKNLAHSGTASGPQILTVQTPRGDQIMRQVVLSQNEPTAELSTGEATPEKPLEAGPETEETVLEEPLEPSPEDEKPDLHQSSSESGSPESSGSDDREAGSPDGNLPLE